MKGLRNISTTKYIPADIVQQIESCMPSYTAGVWRLCCETGVRVSDAICARVKDFDSDNHFHFTAHKTGKKGVALVSSDFLNRYVRIRIGNRYIFRSPYKPNKHVTRQTVYNHVKMACKRLNLDPEGIAPHSSRKFFAVETFHKKGLGATMQALQHRDAGTTMIYALSDDALHKLIVKVRRLEKIVDALSDEVFGNTRYTVTEKGKAYLQSQKEDSEV